MSVAAPQLRFPGFVEPWSPVSMDDALKRVSEAVEVDPTETYREIGVRSHGRGVFHKDPLLGEELGNKRVFRVVPNALVLNIVFAWEQAVAMTSDEEEGFIASHRFPMFLANKEKAHLPFVHRFLLTRLGKNLLELASPGGAGRNKTLGQNEFLKLKAIMPKPNEQEKIADFLDTVDAKLDALRRKKSGLETFKSGLMQRLFAQDLRFARDDGTSFPDWDSVSLKDGFDRIRRKNSAGEDNVLTISAQHGLVSQTEFFNKSVAGADLSGYYHLQKGDFAYNKSYSKGYPAGAIKRLNRYDSGVVSSLYICFRPKEGMLSDFYEQYFDSGGMNSEIGAIAQEGARNHGLLNVSVVDFFEYITVPVPHPDEQRKIADALAAMNAKIAAVAGQITHMETFKKGLLQQMFV